MKNFKIVLSVFLMVFMWILCISCENFLNGSTFRDELEKEIWLSKQEALEIENFSPSDQQSANYKNSSIIISFNHTMNVELTEENILIGSEEGLDDYKSNFQSPVWENENKIIKFIADEYNLIEVPEGLTKTVYVTIKNKIEDEIGVPLSKSKTYHFTINSSFDNTEPVFNQLQIGQSKNKLSKIDFVEGELNDSTYKEILGTNITNETVIIYCEGHDYGGGKLYANISYQQLFNSSGNSYETELITKKIALTDYNNQTKNYGEYYTINLTSSEQIKYTDGLYKFTISLEDESGNLSKETKIYNVIRDTMIEVSSQAYIFHSFPEYRVREDGGEITSNWCDTASINKINERRTYIFKAEEQFKSDTYFVYKSENVTEEIKTDYNDFEYTLSYGLSFNDFDVNDDQLKIDEIKQYHFSDEFIKYAEQNKDKNIYIRMNYYDKAGNSSYKDGCIPAMPEIINYTYDSSSQTVNFNLIDKSELDLSDYLGMTSVMGNLEYRIFYGKKDGATAIEDVPLQRNSYYTDADQYDDQTDSFSIKINPSSEYVVCIVTQYKFFDKNDWSWCGTWYSPVLVIDNVTSADSQNFQFSKPEFTYTKESNGINSSNFTLYMDYTNKEDGVNYYPAWSTDGINYSLYSANAASIVVPSCIEPPVYGDFLNDYVSKCGDNEWTNSSAYTPPQNYYRKAYLKVIGVKGSSMINSDVQEVVFTKNEDNTPPVFTTWTKGHELIYTDDLKSLQTRHCVIDDTEWNLKDTFTFYYTEYKESWGNNTSILSDDQIEAIKDRGTGTFDRWFGYGDSDHTYVTQTNYMYIPTEGLPDGKYMFFYKVEDLKGNYVYGTLGKAEIGSFKNQVNVNYDKTNDEVKVSLDLFSDEIREHNKVQVRYIASYDDEPNYYWDYYSNSAEEVQPNTFGKRREMTKDGNMLSYTQKTRNYSSDGTYWTPSACFARADIYSYDIDYSCGFSDSSDIVDETISDYVYDNYDSKINDKISYTKYFFVPSENHPAEDLVCNKKYFSSASGYSPILICDKPVLVQYIKCNENLGSSLDEWERRGTILYNIVYNDWTNYKNETELRDSYPSCTELTQLDTSIVQKQEGDFYYIVAVHFVDGTSDMSVVYQK